MILPWKYQGDTLKDQLQQFCLLNINYPKSGMNFICHLYLNVCSDYNCQMFTVSYLL